MSEISIHATPTTITTFSLKRSGFPVQAMAGSRNRQGAISVWRLVHEIKGLGDQFVVALEHTAV